MMLHNCMSLMLDPRRRLTPIVVSRWTRRLAPQPHLKAPSSRASLPDARDAKPSKPRPQRSRHPYTHAALSLRCAPSRRLWRLNFSTTEDPPTLPRGRRVLDEGRLACELQLAWMLSWAAGHDWVVHGCSLLQAGIPNIPGLASQLSRRRKMSEWPCW